MEKPEFYEIRVEDRLPDEVWSYWFEGLTTRFEASGITVLSGLIVDQSALHGVLGKLHDLHLKLISVNRIDPAQPPANEKAGSC